MQNGKNSAMTFRTRKEINVSLTGLFFLQGPFLTSEKVVYLDKFPSSLTFYKSDGFSKRKILTEANKFSNGPPTKID